MGEAKRRGNYQERVSEALTRDQANMTTQIQAQVQFREHMHQLEARRTQMESQMGPMDKLYVDQHQMLQQAAQKLKEMEGKQTKKETPQATITSVASEVSLGEQLIQVETNPSLLVTEPSEPVTTIVPTPEQSDVGTAHFDDLTPITNEP